jgi:hypothetical protein
MHSTYWSSSSLQEWIVDSRDTRHMTKHHQLLSYYEHQHLEEKVIIGDNLPLQMSSCDNVVIDNPKFGGALHVPRLRLNLLYMYHIKPTNKKV